MALPMTTIRALAVLMSAGLISAAGAQTPPIVGMDHIPVVVCDLEKATADFRAMGFAIKPGRSHADGIQNAHVKFPDGTEIELITAPHSVDALTSEYRAKLQSGEGPVYFGLYAPDHSALKAKLEALGIAVAEDGSTLNFPAGAPLHPLFFGLGEKSPTDRPEHFAHANTALRLSALWVRGNPEESALFRKLGADMDTTAPCGPLKGIVEAVHFSAGDLYLVRGYAGTGAVIAARIEVKSLETVRQVLRESGREPKTYAPCERVSVWLPPEKAHGIWLQFVQAP